MQKKTKNKKIFPKQNYRSCVDAQIDEQRTLFDDERTDRDEYFFRRIKPNFNVTNNKTN